MRQPSQLLFITPTQGTQLRSLPPTSASAVKPRLRFSHTVETTATPEQIWQVWTRVADWASWDTELEWAALEGDFQLDAQGQVKPKSGPVCPFTVTELSPGQSYTFSTQLLLCNLVERRWLRQDGELTYFTHEVSFEGLFAPVFCLWLSRRFQSVLPKVMEQLQALAGVNI